MRTVESFSAGTELFTTDHSPARSSITSTVVALASQMDGSRDFSAMPILADALQDAGCDDEEILTHCRDTSVSHVRGCWVVDTIFGKG